MSCKGAFYCSACLVIPVTDHHTSHYHLPRIRDHGNLLQWQPMSLVQKGSAAPPHSPFLTGKVDSQQDTLLRVLAPAAVHHHHVPDPLCPGALQAHGLDGQRRSHWPAFRGGGPFHHQINIKDFCFLPFPL